MTCKLPDTNLHLGDWSPTPLTPVSLEADGPCIWSKLEFLNPGGSTKDRIASHILTKAITVPTKPRTGMLQISPRMMV